MCSPSVTTARRASIHVGEQSRATVSAAATMRLLRISPVAAIASSQRGDTSRSTAERLHDALELVELAIEKRDHLLALHGIGDDLRDGGVALAQLAQIGLRAFDVAGAGVGGNAEQPIGDLRQRRHDDDRAARVAAFLLRVGLPLRADDGDQPLDGGLIGHRRAAEFHDNHTSC